MSLIAYFLGYFTQVSYFLPLFFLFCLIFLSKSKILIILSFILSFLLSQIHEAHIKPQADVLKQGFLRFQALKVHSFPKKIGRTHQYQLRLQEQTIELYCVKNCPNMFPGETWAWQGKLRPIELYRNFNDNSFWNNPKYRHILGKAYTDGKQLQRIHPISSSDWINLIRKRLYLASSAYFSSNDTQFAKAIFLTLILGVGTELETSDWLMFKNTGIIHLMVVSGAHLHLLLSLVIRLFSPLYYFFPQFALYLPRQTFVTVIALFLGFIYTQISGCGIPIMRAWIMSVFRLLPFLNGAKYSIWQGMRFSIYLILAFEPHAIFYPGAYLSYLAVIGLLLAQDLGKGLKYVQVFLTQLWCNLLMTPLCLLWFGQFPLLGLVVNLFAIPWVSYVILPMVFLNGFLFLMHAPTFCLDFYHLNTSYLKSSLEVLQQLPIPKLEFNWLFLLDAFACLAGIMLLCLLPEWRFRVLGIALIVISLAGDGLRLGKNNFLVEVFDIGQGLSILVHTAHHHLLYDLGPAQASRQALMPYLTKHPEYQLDGLILSHHDADHMGGLPYFLQKYPKLPIVVDSPLQYQTLPIKPLNCHRMSDWCWDGVCFSFLKYTSHFASKNNHSCVLKVSNRKFSLLLTGDIELQAEKRLLHFAKDALKTDVLILAHHGSHSSSSKAFLKASKPSLGVISYGIHNRYGHPHQDILNRLKQFNIPIITTAKEGMLRLYYFNQLWFYQREQYELMDRIKSVCRFSWLYGLVAWQGIW